MFAFHQTVIGSAHVEKGKPCQDASVSYYTPKYAIGIVADGHGGTSYLHSDIGSRKASEVALSVLRELLFATSYFKRIPSGDWQHQVAKSIISRWQDAISNHQISHPLSMKELASLPEKDRNRYAQGEWQFLYGTTLIAVVLTRFAFLGIQIGDGKCVTLNHNGNYFKPIPWDDDCFLNQTTSLCDSDAIHRFRFAFITEHLPVMAFVGTDGLDDSLGNDDRLADFYHQLGSMMQSNKHEAVSLIKSYLPEMSAKGSHDDISIAGLIRSK